MRRMAACVAIGHVRGGLDPVTGNGCVGFVAPAGSSMALALTMGRFGHDGRLSAGLVAAGSTRITMTSPSPGFVIFAILAEQPIGRLFLAVVRPGLVLTEVFILWPAEAEGARGVAPDLRGCRSDRRGIHGGQFSTTEAEGAGAEAVILYGFVTRRLGAWMSADAARQSVVKTATLILIPAHLLNLFIALRHLSALVAATIVGSTWGGGKARHDPRQPQVPGCFPAGFATLVVTLPIFLPNVLALDIDLIRFAVLVVLMRGKGLISPPVGMNAFVARSGAPRVRLQAPFEGSCHYGWRCWRR